MSTNALYDNCESLPTQAFTQQDSQHGLSPESAGVSSVPGNRSLGSCLPLGSLHSISQVMEKSVRQEGKALGTAQMVMGVTASMFGIVSAIGAYNPSSLSGILFWGSLIHIIAGAVIINISKISVHTVACVLKVLNIISIVIAGIAIVLFCNDLSRPEYWRGNQVKVSGISGVMMVLSIGQLAISASILAFTPQIVSSNISQIESKVAAAPGCPPTYEDVSITVNTWQTRSFPTIRHY